MEKSSRSPSIVGETSMTVRDRKTLQTSGFVSSERTYTLGRQTRWLRVLCPTHRDNDLKLRLLTKTVVNELNFKIKKQSVVESRENHKNLTIEKEK